MLEVTNIPLWHFLQNPEPKSGVWNGQLCVIHQRGSGQNKVSGVRAILGGDPDADEPSGDAVYCALSWPRILPALHQLAHHRQRGLGAAFPVLSIFRTFFLNSRLLFLCNRWSEGCKRSWACKTAKIRLHCMSRMHCGSSRSLGALWSPTSWPGLKSDWHFSFSY